MGDYDVNPLNMLLGCLAAVIAVVVIFGMIRSGWAAETRKNDHIKVARYQACGNIPDPALRTICVIGGH